MPVMDGDANRVARELAETLEKWYVESDGAGSAHAYNQAPERAVRSELVSVSVGSRQAGGYTVQRSEYNEEAGRGEAVEMHVAGSLGEALGKAAMLAAR